MVITDKCSDEPPPSKQEKSKGMRICFVTFSYSTISIGGIERYLNTTINELIKRGHTVDVITASYNNKNKIEKEGNLTIHSLRFMNTEFSNKEIGGRRLYNYLKNLVNQKKIDIISAENFYRGTPPSYAFAVNLVSLETGVPAILRMHAHFKREIEKSLVKDLMWSKIVSISKSVNKESYNAGVRVKKLVVVYPGVNTELFRPDLGKEWLRKRIEVSDSDILILHASRITGSKRHSYLELKGITTLLESFSMLAQKHKNIKLLIAAARPPKVWKKDFDEAIQKIKDLAEIQGFGNKIIIQPFELQEMPFVYNGSDIFVMASQMESFGIVYTEAMACGLPVIGTSVGGVPEIIINNATGFLVAPDNPVELEKKIEIFINDEKKREKLGKAGMHRIQSKFNVKKTIDRLIGIFQSCIENNNIQLKSQMPS